MHDRVLGPAQIDWPAPLAAVTVPICGLVATDDLCLLPQRTSSTVYFNWSNIHVQITDMYNALVLDYTSILCED